MSKRNNQGLKRIILTLGVMMIAIAMSFTFVGCGSSGADETSESVPFYGNPSRKRSEWITDFTFTFVNIHCKSLIVNRLR